MRSWLALLVAVSALAFAPRAHGATLTFVDNALEVRIGGLPPITLGGAPTVAFVSSGAGSFTVPAGIAGPATIPLARSLFTGVPQISGLTLGAVSNGTVAFNGANGTAIGGLGGFAVINILGLINLSIPLQIVGAGGATSNYFSGGISISVVGQNWTTGVASVTGITTTTPGTAVLHTVFATGSDNRTPLHAGTVTLVSGFQMLTNVAGNLPGFAILSFDTPEPGTLLLLGSGVVALLLRGRRLSRR